jgi:signal transduction histidine kinase
MGLNICRTTVEAMGGKLTVRNLPNGGAGFSFDLPIADADPA